MTRDASYHRDWRKRTGFNTKYRRRQKQLSGVQIDWEVYDRICKKAKDDKQSISETIRTLLEWGLEAEKR